MWADKRRKGEDDTHALQRQERSITQRNANNRNFKKKLMKLNNK